MPAESPTQVVNEYDQPVGVEIRSRVQQEGLWHRIIGVWLCDEETGDILVQERLSGRGLDDGKIDSSASGHVDPGEDYKTTAVRETFEELGVSIEEDQLEEIAYFQSQATQGEKILNRFTKVFVVKVGRSVLESINLKEDELESTKIFAWAEFEDLVENYPDRTVPGVVIAHFIAKGQPVPETVVKENKVVVLDNAA